MTGFSNQMEIHRVCVFTIKRQATFPPILVYLKRAGLFILEINFQIYYKLKFAFFDKYSIDKYSLINFDIMQGYDNQILH